MPRSRGVSEVVGVVLLLGITIATVTATVSIGNAALQQDQDRLTVEQAELQAGAFHRAVSSASDGSGATARFDAAGLHTDVDPQQGWVNVTVRNTSSGDTVGWRNASLGTVRFAQSEPHLVYQGGAVFRVEDGYALVRERPEFSYRNESMGFAIRTIGGNVTTNGGIVLQQGNTTPVYPQAGLTNPVENTEIEITIHSRYYRAWERIFEDAGADAVTDAGRETVSATFLATDRRKVTSAIAVGKPGTTLTLDGGVSADSYNSTVGAYQDRDSKNSSGRIVSAGSVDVTGGANLQGGIRTGGDLTVDGGSTLTGDVAVGGNLSISGGADVDSSVSGDARVGHDVKTSGGAQFSGHLTYGGTLNDGSNAIDDATEVQPFSVPVAKPHPVTHRVKRAVKNARQENDDANASAVDGETLACAGSNTDDCTLSAGTYYFDELTLQNGHLYVDTGGGDVTIAVDGDTNIDSGTVRVRGDGRVNLYVNGSYAMDGDGKVVNDGDDAPQFWTYVPENGSIDLDGDRYTGVIYGPNAAVSVHGGSAVYGALVGDISLGSYGVGIHYDAALQNEEPVPLPPGTSRVSYAHARVDAVNASS